MDPGPSDPDHAVIRGTPRCHGSYGLESPSPLVLFPLIAEHHIERRCHDEEEDRAITANPSRWGCSPNARTPKITMAPMIVPLMLPMRR